MITNFKRAAILAVMYSVFGVAGLICMIARSELMYALLFNAANGLFAISCFKRLKINIFLKLGLFAVGVFAVIKLYGTFWNASLQSSLLVLFALLSNIIGLLIIFIARATLTRSKTYFLLNLVIVPISFVCALLCTQASLFIGIGMSLLLGATAIIFVWYAGGAPRYESEHIYYQYETSDGRVLTHSHDNCYTDGNGGYYELSSDGLTMSEL